ncbi:MAG: DNA-binding response regulator, partial [Chloroflexota bacterium]|nr:DNA-binding response regulator [Chloroflexota bacterium]
DPHTVEVVQFYLCHDGHDVLSATDGITGLSLAREAQPDLIVLDLPNPAAGVRRPHRHVDRPGR